MDYMKLKSSVESAERRGIKIAVHTRRALIRLKREHEQRAEPSPADRRVQIQHVGGAWISVRVSDQSDGQRNVTQQGYHLTERRWATTHTHLREGEKISALKLINKLREQLMSSEPHCVHTT
tara:strand:+ start:1609 stop:1974 length:366 start_codon:yes stop_codon:yes gene_type:complete